MEKNYNIFGDWDPINDIKELIDAWDKLTEKYNKEKIFSKP